MFLADTAALIDFLRGTGRAERIAIEIGTGRLCTPAISAFGLWAGSNTSQQMATVRSLLKALAILPLDKLCARRAGEIRRNLEHQGRTIGMADSMIAGIAVEHDAILITRNRKHCACVPGLKRSHHGESCIGRKPGRRSGAIVLLPPPDTQGGCRMDRDDGMEERQPSPHGENRC